MRILITFFICASLNAQIEGAAVLALTGTSAVGTPVDVSDRVNQNNMDAEQTTTFLETSNDLEMNWGGAPSTVGLFFNNLNIPAGATINSATVQFQSFDTRTGSVSVTIYGQASASPAIFAPGFNDLNNNRPRTTASVAWSNIPNWTTGQNDADTRTPDLSTIIQEIVDAGYYTQGDAIVILIEPTTGSNRRSAVAHDSNPSVAPEISINYTPN